MCLVSDGSRVRILIGVMWPLTRICGGVPVVMCRSEAPAWTMVCSSCWIEKFSAVVIGASAMGDYLIPSKGTAPCWDSPWSRSLLVGDGTAQHFLEGGHSFEHFGER